MNVDFLEFRSSTEINLNNYLTRGIYKISKALFFERVKDYGYQILSYSYCFKMQYEGEDIGFLYTKSMDLSFEYGLNILFRIDNKVFYIGNIGLILKTLVDALGLTKTIIKRLDICYDTDTDVLSLFKNLYEDETSTIFRFGNKINVTGTGKKNKVVYVGSMTGKVKCIAIYNKTIEINHSHKEYIREIHRKKFGYKNIYRVELRIKERTLEIKDIDIMCLDKSEYLETIFNTYFDNLVQFLDVNTNEKIDFIVLNKTGKKLDRVVKKKVVSGIKQIKAHINFLDKESKTSEFRGNVKGWNQIRGVLLKKYELETWYSVKKKMINILKYNNIITHTQLLYSKNNTKQMLEKYDQFTQRKKSLDSQIASQKKQHKQRISGLKRQKLALKMNQLKKQMYKSVAGSSSFSRDNF